MSKKICSLVLAVAMLLTCLSGLTLVAAADEGAFAEISFANDEITTVNGNIQHNHPDEDDGDAGNGIYPVTEGSDLTGIKMSWQNHGFGFKVGDVSFLTGNVKITIGYYGNAKVVKDNSRLSVQTAADGYNGYRFENLTKDAVDVIEIVLTGAARTRFLKNPQVQVGFWNYGDNPSNGDYAFVTNVRVENDPFSKAALQATLDETPDLTAYTSDTAVACWNAMTAAKAVLADDNATQEQIDAAALALDAAFAALQKAAPAGDAYTLTNATVSNLTDGQNGEVVAKDVDGTMQYVWKYAAGSDKWLGIGDPDGVLANATSVTYEYDIMFDTNDNNDRCFLSNGTKTYGWTGVNENTTAGNFNGFAAGGQWLKPVPDKGKWGTITLVNNDFDATKTNNGCITRLGSWVTNGTLYVKAVRVYDIADKTKMISLVFNEAEQAGATDAALLKAIVNAPTFTAGKTTASKKAYADAIAAGQALLSNANAKQAEVDKAVKDILAAEKALKDIIAVTHKTEISAAEATINGDGRFNTGADNCIGNTGGNTVVTFEVDVQQTGTYKLGLMAYTGAGKTNLTVGNGSEAYDVVALEGSKWGNDNWPKTPHIVEADLKAGVQFVTISFSNSANLRYISFELETPELTGHSVTLNGDIGLNYYFKSDEQFDVVDAQVTVGDQDAVEAPVVEAEDGYKVTARMAAKEMTDTVTVVLNYNNGNQSAPYTYSVKRYADEILGNEKYVDAQDLVKAMLNYGGYAQDYFGYKTENKANVGVTVDMSGVTAAKLEMYKNTDAQKNDNVSLYAANLSLLSETTLRLFFKNADGTIESVEVANIPAHKLSETVTVTYKDLTVTYSPMAYCYNALNSAKTTENLKNVIKALVLYNEAAVEYAKNHSQA